MQKCACDCCSAVRGAASAWTPDGFCGHCDAWCFPAIEVNGRASRASIPLEDRRARHGMAEPAPPPPVVLPFLPLFARQIVQVGYASLKTEAQRTQVAAVLQAAEALQPVAPLLGRIAAGVRRFLR